VNDPIRFRRSAVTLVRNVGAEVLLTAAGNDDIDRLSGTAAAIWHVLEVPRTSAEVAHLVAGSFGEEDRIVMADVEAFLAELLQRGWVEPVSR